MKPIKYCKQMDFREKVERVWVYRYRTPDGQREQFIPGQCRICGNPLSIAWRVFDKGKLTAEYETGSEEAAGFNQLIDDHILHRISERMVFPVTVCDAIANDQVWKQATEKEEDRKREMARALEPTQPVKKRAQYAGAF